MHASVIPSKCNGYFCDWQRFYDFDKQQTGWVCFQSGNRLSDIVFSCNLKIKFNIMKKPQSLLHSFAATGLITYL